MTSMPSMGSGPSGGGEVAESTASAPSTINPRTVTFFICAVKGIVVSCLAFSPFTGHKDMPSIFTKNTWIRNTKKEEVKQRCGYRTFGVKYGMRKLLKTMCLSFQADLLALYYVRKLHMLLGPISV